ncbi:MAG: 50S ribosomal protein L6 [Candidatus Hydrothermarchaeaceae archaeon]
MVMAEKRVPIPEGVEVSLEGSSVVVKGPKGEVKKTMEYPGIVIKKDSADVVIETENPKKRQFAILGTYESHTKNMIKGVSEGFEYKMKVIYSHFPMSVKVEQNGIVVENYLGEKVPRKTRIVGNCEVKIKGTEITITGNNIEEVGQTAANLEQATKVKNKDCRVFQDGVYLVERNGVGI